ncbi:hypothetical protein FRC10_006987 [Ceratobasidium sp. 414]|nr:hypothetical protein FRC10_006987 [Ceratobasidium sp. 414]
MAAAEALMELVPSGHLRKTSSQGGSAGVENGEEKERVMAATYAAYTKRAKLQAEKTKAQQLKTRLQFARLKVDYGWALTDELFQRQTRQSLNEVENLYFHLSRARPTHQAPVARPEPSATSDAPVAGPSTPPTAVDTPTESQEEQVALGEASTQSTQIESPLPGSSQPQSQTKPSSSTSDPTLPRPVSQSSLPDRSVSPAKRSPFVERTRTGGIVRPTQPVERLRTGGKVWSSLAGTSPKKRGRPRIPDVSEPVSMVAVATAASGVEGGPTYDSFWSTLGSMKSSST